MTLIFDCITELRSTVISLQSKKVGVKVNEKISAVGTSVDASLGVAEGILDGSNVGQGSTFSGKGTLAIVPSNS